jgi:hypothetical protein
MVVNTYYYDNNDRLGIDETVKMINIIQLLYKYYTNTNTRIIFIN